MLLLRTLLLVGILDVWLACPGVGVAAAPGDGGDAGAWLGSTIGSGLGVGQPDAAPILQARRSERVSTMVAERPKGVPQPLTGRAKCPRTGSLWRVSLTVVSIGRGLKHATNQLSTSSKMMLVEEEEGQHYTE